MVVKPEHPANSAKDLVALAKDKPGAVPFASTGAGSMPHLAIELLQAAAGVKFLHVPYRGAAPALTDLLGGQVQALFADTPVLLPHIRGGKLKPIAAAAGQPQPAAARRGHARRAGLSRHRGRQLVRPAGAGQDAARRGGEIARRRGGGAQCSGYPREARAGGRRALADVERGVRQAPAPTSTRAGAAWCARRASRRNET